MEADLLRKVQLVELDILRELDRVCREHDISYFLYRGTFLGAIRHGGFIPWDDDMDVAMLREDYEKFCQVAPQALSSGYALQNWHTDPQYALPFGKLRKRGTRCVEGKSPELKENGLYIDIYPLDSAPEDAAERERLSAKLLHLFRIKLMKSGYTPWVEEDHIVWKKRIGYLSYRFMSFFVSQKWLISHYEALVSAVPENKLLYEQSALSKVNYFRRDWCETLTDYAFEDGYFPGPKDYDACLSELYGDYMTPPPEGTRENRHLFSHLEFGE